MLRVAVTPEQGALVDPRLTTAPFVSLTGLEDFLPVIGVSSVRHLLRRASSLLQATGTLPVTVRVPLATTADEPVPGAPNVTPLRTMVFVPDPSPADGGFVLSRVRWSASNADAGEDTFAISKPLTLRGKPPKMLPCSEFAAALARHPDLSLSEYNFAPSVPISRLAHVVLRTAATPLESSTVDPTLTTWPFVSLQNLRTLSPVLGVTDVRRHVERAILALLSAEAPPSAVFVPIATPGDIADEAPRVHAMLFVPDEDSGGWLITAARWEQATGVSLDKDNYLTVEGSASAGAVIASNLSAIRTEAV